MAVALSKASEYEQKFGTRHRGPGRPAKDGEGVMFPAQEVHPVLARVAQRRAYAIVHAENEARLNELYLKELAVLKRRGVETVAADSRITLAEDSSSATSAVA